MAHPTRRTAFFAMLGLPFVIATVSARAAPPAVPEVARLHHANPVGLERAPAEDGSAAPTVSLAEAKQALEDASAALAGGGAAPDASTALAELGAALPSLHGDDRRRGKALLARPTDGFADPHGRGYRVPARSTASAHFCYFWVESGEDAVPLADDNSNGLPDYVELLAGVSERVWIEEHNRLGWRFPPSDGSLGCDGGDGRSRVDVYTTNTGARGIYGYAAPDPGQTGVSRYSYLVIDNDQAEFAAQYGGGLPPMKVTVAHEYNHVIQFGYDVHQDPWMLESIAVWIEEKVFPGVNDYLQFIGRWAREVERPITDFEPLASNKYYGSAVWNHFLSHRFGDAMIEKAFAASTLTNPQHLGVKAYDRAIRNAPGRHSFGSEFVHFAAATAEWRSTSVFPDSASYPEVKRTGTLAPAEPRYDAYELDHTTFRLAKVPVRSGDAVKLVLRAPRGVAFGLALVGRIGKGPGARVISVARNLPDGGVGAVNLSGPDRFSRITAVLVNADIAIGGSTFGGDWIYTGDDSRIRARTVKLR